METLLGFFRRRPSNSAAERSDADDHPSTTQPTHKDKLALSRDTWRESRQRNTRESPICRLPTELLQIIFRKGEFLDQQMVRQVCSLFAAVISNLNGSQANEPFDIEFGNLQVWRCHGSPSERTAIRQQWASRVRPDITDLCKACKVFDESGHLDDRLIQLGEPLWCTGCRLYHKRGFFPASERGRWSSRECIGRKGRITTCPHFGLSWETVDRTKQRLTQNGRLGIDLPQFSCPQGCHWKGCTNSLQATPTPSTLSPSFVSCWRNHRYLLPRFTIALTWANRLFDIDETSTTSIQKFRDFFSTLDTGSGPYLCPHVDFKDGGEQLLRPLQPPFCSCFPDEEERGYRVQPHTCSSACSNHANAR